MKTGVPTSKAPAAARGAPLTAASLEELQRKLVSTAAAALRVPVSGMKLERGHGAVTHRVANGVGVKDEGSITPLWSSLTSHLWYVRQPLAIADLSRGRAVLGTASTPGAIRSCLAAPLLGPGGRFLGALCVADERPRAWTDEEVKRLESLANRAGEEIDERMREPEMTGRPEHPLGRIDAFADAVSAMTRASAERAPNAGRSSEELMEELDVAMEELNATVEELRAVNEELQASRLIIESQREHYRELFDRVPYAYLVTNGAGVIQEMNAEAAALLGTKPGFITGKPIELFVEPGERQGFRRQLRQLATSPRGEWSVVVAPRKGPPRPLLCIASAVKSDAGVERVHLLLRPLDDAPAQAPRALEPAEANTGEESTDGHSSRSADFERVMARAVPTKSTPVASQLRGLIAGAVNVGTLRTGQRLPSIRAIAEKFGVTPYAALQAYATLEAEGVVERRERSGVYIAAMDWPAQPALPETADWLSAVLTQACDHQLRIPQLPDLIRRWTSAVQVRAVCVDSCPDTRAALIHELGSRFGLNAVGASLEELLAPGATPRRMATLPPAVRDGDLLVTTPFHASEIRSFAEAVGKPVLVATVNREIVRAVDAHVADRELVVISTGAVFGERLRDLHGGVHRNRIRSVLVDEIDPAGIDASVPVFVTHAARQRLNGRPLRLIAPPFPFFSLEFARKVANLVLRLNIDAGRA